MPNAIAANYSRFAYIDDGINPPSYISLAEPASYLEDRGAHFSDGVYEVIAIISGKMIDGEGHFKRFKRSLSELEINFSVSKRRFEIVINELLRRNNLTDAAVYIQITRGFAKRNHLFPKNVSPALTIFTYPLTRPSSDEIEKGVSVISGEDIRWLRRDIKSISLLPNAIAKQKAYKNNSKEVWLVQDGIVTEGSSTNAYIIKKGEVITHPLNNFILGGITRDSVLRLAKKNGIKIKEKAFSLKEAYAADEAFLTSTTAFVLPIIKIDGKKIGDGKPGKITKKIIDLYNNEIKRAVDD